MAVDVDHERAVDVNHENMAVDVNHERAGTRPAPTAELGTIIGELKSIITNEYIKNVKQNNWPKFNKRLFQRNYYERIIRNEKEYFIYKKYIKENPVKINVKIHHGSKICISKLSKDCRV
jgi:hypothetical protein